MSVPPQRLRRSGKCGLIAGHGPVIKIVHKSWRRDPAHLENDVAVSCLGSVRRAMGSRKLEDGMFTRCLKVSCRPKLVASAFILIAAVALSGSPAYAGCWSVLKSPKWTEVQASLAKVKLCEALPAGPNHTDKLSISDFDVCDAPGGVRFHAEAELQCKSGPKGLIKISAKATVKADVAVDIGTCTVTEAKLDLGGDAGKLLAGQPGFQRLAQGLAQAKLSELCGK
jgi:hypothetical protein